MTQMIYNRLGASNLQVSALCLGTMMFGDQTEAPVASQMVASARDMGVNFIDTADVYARGASEKMLAPLINPGRDQWVLASKLGNPMSKKPNERGYSRSWMMRAAENSLQRLETDYLDILYMHLDREEDSLEEPLRCLEDLIRAGKIRYYGISNFRGWRIAEISRMAESMNMPAPVVLQPYYNLLNRQPEVEVLPAAEYYGLGVVPYSPIARGLLTGKYKPGEKPSADSRAGRSDARMLQTEWREESLQIAAQLNERAQEKGVTLAQYASAWVLNNPIISSVIAGPRTLEQWQSYEGALAVPWTDEDEALVDSLVPPGHASTPGYHDPKYPILGRPVA